MDATKYLQKAEEIFEKIGAKVWLKKVNDLIPQLHTESLGCQRENNSMTKSLNYTITQ